MKVVFKDNLCFEFVYGCLPDFHMQLYAHMSPGLFEWTIEYPKIQMSQSDPVQPTMKRSLEFTLAAPLTF